MTTPHVIASSSGGHHAASATSNGIVGSNYRVGKKIGEGSFGVVFEGTYAFRILRRVRSSTFEYDGLNDDRRLFDPSWVNTPGAQ